MNGPKIGVSDNFKAQDGPRESNW